MSQEVCQASFGISWHPAMASSEVIVTWPSLSYGRRVKFVHWKASFKKPIGVLIVVAVCIVARRFDHISQGIHKIW